MIVLASHMGRSDKRSGKDLFSKELPYLEVENHFPGHLCKTGSGNHQIIFGVDFLTNHLILVFRKVGPGNIPPHTQKDLFLLGNCSAFYLPDWHASFHASLKSEVLLQGIYISPVMQSKHPLYFFDTSFM